MPLALALALAAAGTVSAPFASPLLLQVRIFNGSEEVTGETRITLHRAGDRGEPVAQAHSRDGRLEVPVPAGIYDLQAIRERDGRVLSIRWAQRLVVMPYPDEEGRHLEVINFTNGYGALQVRQRGATTAPDADIYAPTDHEKPLVTRAHGRDYVLFVVPAGQYDVLSRDADRVTWHREIEVPLDRTRLWFEP